MDLETVIGRGRGSPLGNRKVLIALSPLLLEVGPIGDAKGKGLGLLPEAEEDPVGGTSVFFY